MKKLFTLLTLVVLGTAMFTACSKDDENTGTIEEEEVFLGAGSIAVVYEGSRPNFHIYTFNEGETVTVYWGDGKVETFRSVPETDSNGGYVIDAFHSYPTEKQYTIKFASDMKIKEFISRARAKSIDVSQCTNLERLVCDGDHLTSLDVSKNLDLRRLECNGNQLTSLDVSKNVDLGLLSCGGNQLTSLDVSKNVDLSSLGCSDNQLTSLDISKNVRLYELKCYDNQLSASAMNQVYNALPNNGMGCFIYISEPFGDYSIAKGKGWRVIEYPGGEEL